MTTVNRYGRLITRRREQQLRKYTTARLDLAELYAKRGLSDVYYYAMRMWVYDFEKFMCRGFDPSGEGRSDKRLPGVQVRLAVAEDTRHPNVRSEAR